MLCDLSDVGNGGSSLENVRESLAGWKDEFGSVNPPGLLTDEEMSRLTTIPRAEFVLGGTAHPELVVDILVTGLVSDTLSDSWLIHGRWDDLAGKPRVVVRYNFLKKTGTLERVNDPIAVTKFLEQKGFCVATTRGEATRVSPDTTVFNVLWDPHHKTKCMSEILPLFPSYKKVFVGIISFRSTHWTLEVCGNEHLPLMMNLHKGLVEEFGGEIRLLARDPLLATGQTYA